jgi:hypothetical protein
LLTLLMAAVVSIVINPVVNSGRTHIDYDPVMNSVATRLAILVDVGFGNSEDADPDSTELPTILLRLSVLSIQGYLIDEYEKGRPGNSLDDFWTAMIPRVFWPAKPSITRFGAELHGQYFSVADPTSALAPTYSAEAYWNYGPLGLVLVSVLLGLEFGWLTRRWQLALAGRDPAFFLIAFPAVLGGLYVETWVAASYIGGFMTLVGVWFVARPVFSRHRATEEREFA